MNESIDRASWWDRHQGLKDRRPPAVVAAIDAVGSDLPADAGADEVVSALTKNGPGIFDCAIGLIVLRNVPLGEAKRLVHEHQAFAQTRDDREAFWADLHQGLQQLADAGEIELVDSNAQDPDYARNDVEATDLDEGHNRR